MPNPARPLRIGDLIEVILTSEDRRILEVNSGTLMLYRARGHRAGAAGPADRAIALQRISPRSQPRAPAGEFRLRRRSARAVSSGGTGRRSTTRRNDPTTARLPDIDLLRAS
jgi:hypothetical protein